LPRNAPHADAQLVAPLLAIVREVAAREIMPRYLRVAHSRKADGSLFTEADLASQDALKAALSRLVQVPVLAEEMSQQEQALQWLEGDAGLWCVDPIDGTSNFVNGLPYFAVSVALMRQGRPVVGVVYDPVSDEAFHASRGHGAFLNDERLPIKTYVPVLKNAMAGVDLKRLDRKLAQSLAVHVAAKLRRKRARMVLRRRGTLRRLSARRAAAVGLRSRLAHHGRSRRADMQPGSR
jgi:myo-inositol-1(or 4)-monophosphatase